MLRNLLTVAAVAAVFASAGGAAAARSRHADVEVRDAWSRPAAAGTTGAGFATLENHGRRADALLRVESPLVRAVEIHQTRMEGGVMSMSRIERLPVPAGGSVTLAPGGAHLMLIDLSKAIGPGDRIPAILTFASGARLSVQFEVRTTPPAGGAHHQP